MEYTVNKLAKLAGVSARTLRYYDELGLLSPMRQSTNGYRIYGPAEVDRLQQILFFRELGVPLDEIKQILSAEGFDGQAALQSHLAALWAKRAKLDTLIRNVETTIRTMKGETSMSDKEKFEGFLQEKVNENEKAYGAEIRAKYGDDTVDQSNAKLKGMTEAQYAEVERLSEEINETLKAAFEAGDPAGELAQKTAALHKEWLCYFWPAYSPEAHIGVAQMYVDDPRFAAHYDNIVPGGAVFLRDAIRVFCRQ